MSLRFAILSLLSALASAAEPRAFLEQHCYECHDKETKKGGLDLESLSSEKQQLDRWIKIHDAVADGEMPPAKKKTQPTATERNAFVAALDTRLTAASTASHPVRTQLRRLTRQEFENSLKDLLALPRLDITGMLPADGRVSGYDKIGSGLDLSPGHLAAYQEAIEKALDLAIATQSTAPRVYNKRIYPAGLFKFGANLSHGQYVLLKDKQPDAALPVRGGYEDKKGHVGFEGPDLKDRGALVKSPAVTKSQSAVGLLNPNLAGYEAAMNVSPIFAGNYRLRLPPSASLCSPLSADSPPTRVRIGKAAVGAHVSTASASSSQAAKCPQDQLPGEDLGSRGGRRALNKLH